MFEQCFNFQSVNDAVATVVVTNQLDRSLSFVSVVVVVVHNNLNKLWPPNIKHASVSISQKLTHS